MPFQNSSARTPRHGLILAGIMAVLVLLVVVIVLLAVFNSGRRGTPGSGTLQWKGSGTTEHLQEIVLGRCYNFIATVNPALNLAAQPPPPTEPPKEKERGRGRPDREASSSSRTWKQYTACIQCMHTQKWVPLCAMGFTSRNKNCLEIWHRLEHAIAFRDPCSMTEEDYQPLMDLASYFIPCNKSLFWSKTKDLVHRFTKANHDFLTLEDTLVGYIADELSWCGDLVNPGINYQSCPKWSECENNHPSTLYWKMASKMFAKAACGTVQVMLNGSIETGAFRNDSFFGGIEVPNLNPDKVSMVHIWLMHDTDGPQSESCTGPSITTLKNILTSRKINVSCEENYRPAQLLQCASNPDHPTCRLCPYTVQ